MNVLAVWVRCADGTVRLAGRLGATEPAANSGRFESEFEYDASWTENEYGFPLDPEALPFGGPTRFSAQSFYPPLAVFQDALSSGIRATVLSEMPGGGSPILEASNSAEDNLPSGRCPPHCSLPL